VEHIEHVLSRPCSKPYDQRVGEWYRRDANLPVLYPSYSLVDHADHDTLVDHGAPRPRPRVAHRVGLGPVNSRMVELRAMAAFGRAGIDGCGPRSGRLVRLRMRRVGSEGRRSRTRLGRIRKLGSLITCIRVRRSPRWGLTRGTFGIVISGVTVPVVIGCRRVVWVRCPGTGRMTDPLGGLVEWLIPWGRGVKITGWFWGGR